MSEPGIFWIDTPELKGRLAIVRRPRGRQDLAADLSAYRQRGLDAIVSMLEEDEAQMLGLADQAAESARHGLSFVSFPIADFATPPSLEQTLVLVDGLAGLLEKGKCIGFHCMASRGRSPTVAACLLVQQGLEAADAVARISTARGLDVPETPGQLDWIHRFERYLADRCG